MKQNQLIHTANGYYYIYLPSEHTFHLLPQDCIPYWTGEKPLDSTYESNKVRYFQKLCHDKEKVEFTTEYSPLKLKNNLSNLDHLLIEVTDKCNLSCKYCGYGELYGNYDKRKSKNNTFHNVKVLIDYLQILWNSNENLSFSKTCHIGFYGGEPLVNFKLIKETIDYLETLPVNNKLKFKYGMTTNAILLHKHIDYLVDKKIQLLISLDGNEYNDSYRITKNGQESFQQVVHNISTLKDKYPKYFEQYVDFNAVLHNRNSVKEIISYIKENFNKMPAISSLATSGIKEDKQKEFITMFHNQEESYKEAGNCIDLKGTLSQSPEISMATFFINAYCTQTFKKYTDLFLSEKDKTYIPTGTCSPLKRKLFLTVNGKLLACERIGQKYPLGGIYNGKVILNFEYISTFYKNLFEKIIPLCKNCAINKGCGMCIFHHNSLEEEKIHCKAYIPKQKLTSVFSEYLFYFENKRESFNKVINETFII